MKPDNSKIDTGRHSNHQRPIYLRTIRERRRLTQEGLAEASGVKQNTISRLEKFANSQPSFATVAALARALSVDMIRFRWGPDPSRDGPIDQRRRLPPPVRHETDRKAAS